METEVSDAGPRGLAVRADVMGGVYAVDEFARPLQELVAEYCWGTVWSRPGLERDQRSLITVAMLIALGKPQELTLHLKGALNVGWSAEALREVVIHSAAYCGIPASLEAMRCLKAAIEDGGGRAADAGLAPQHDLQEG